MVLKPLFHLPFSSLATTPNTCFKNDQEKNTTHSVAWLLLIVISSIFVYAVCSGFRLPSFLLTCSTLLVCTFALPLLRTNLITSERNTKTQLNNTSKLKKEEEEEEEPIVQEENDLGDPDSDPDSVSGSASARDCSDGSISDEESLIEIELPSGYYINPNKQEFDDDDHHHHEQQQLPLVTRCGGIQQKWCYSIESFQHQNLMAELLAEINEFYEEDNMIEIDLSMGLIKCPRFEIQA